MTRTAIDAKGAQNGTWWTSGLGYAVTLFMAAAALSFRYTFWTGCFISPTLYADGQERMPFQARVLTAWIMHPLAHSHLLSAATRITDNSLPATSRGPYFLALALIVFVALLVATLACRAILLHYTRDKVFSSWFSLLIIYCSYFNLTLGYGVKTQPYDVPALAFMTIGIWLIVTDRLWWLVLLVLVSSFNRETAIFLPVFLVLRWWFSTDRKQPARVLGSALLQAAVCLAARAYVEHLFAGRPVGDAAYDGILSIHLFSNLRLLIKPHMWPLFFSTFGFTLPVLFLEFRSIPDRAFAKATLWVIALWIALMLVVGVFSEVRIYNELTALIAPCVALIAWAYWQRQPALTFGKDVK